MSLARRLVAGMPPVYDVTVSELRGSNRSDFKTYANFAECPNPDAVNRLATLYDAPDSIARFRLSNKKRLYGFLVDNEFHLLWWDPNHEVWPTKEHHKKYRS